MIRGHWHCRSRGHSLVGLVELVAVPSSGGGNANALIVPVLLSKAPRYKANYLEATNCSTLDVKSFCAYLSFIFAMSAPPLSKLRNLVALMTAPMGVHLNALIESHVGVHLKWTSRGIVAVKYVRCRKLFMLLVLFVLRK